MAYEIPPGLLYLSSFMSGPEECRPFCLLRLWYDPGDRYVGRSEGTASTSFSATSIVTLQYDYYSIITPLLCCDEATRSCSAVGTRTCTREPRPSPAPCIPRSGEPGGRTHDKETTRGKRYARGIDGCEKMLPHIAHHIYRIL